MIYFAYYTFAPNVASTNRALAYFRNLDRMRIPITAVFFLPDGFKSKISEQFQYVKIKYYWDYIYINNKIIKYLLFFLYLKFFRHQLKEGDKVYVYAHSEICETVLYKKGVKVYYEVTECPEVSFPHTPIYRASLHRHFNLCKRVDSLFVISSHLRDYYVINGVDADKIHIINMIVDSARFNNLEKQSVANRYIAYCGAATNNKDGVDELLKAFALFSTRHVDVLLYIIGEPPHDYEEVNNRFLAKQLGIEERVIFTGVVSSSIIPQMLKNAIILALDRPDNKQAKYGFPTKLGEYLMTENPVVITRVGDIPLFLKDGESALIASPNDSKSFAEKLCWAVEHPMEASRIGKKGKEVALQSFNAQTEILKVLRIIQN